VGGERGRVKLTKYCEDAMSRPERGQSAPDASTRLNWNSGYTAK